MLRTFTALHYVAFHHCLRLLFACIGVYGLYGFLTVISLFSVWKCVRCLAVISLFRVDVELFLQYFYSYLLWSMRRLAFRVVLFRCTDVYGVNM